MTKIKFYTKNELIAYKNTITLTDIQKDIIIGTLLGNASMSLGNNKPVYAIKFEQSIKHAGYVNHLFGIFEAFCMSTPATRIIRKGELRESIYFKTLRHSCFIYYFNLFYKIEHIVNNETGAITLKKTKIIPKNIHQFLTPRAVAYWFMDDGTFDCNSLTSSRSYVFSTQGFEKYECARLLKALNTNFNLKGELHKDRDKWRIYINRDSSKVLKDIMKPFIHSNFTYKL
jgi:LAGLIDADG DNA endonuclease family